MAIAFVQSATNNGSTNTVTTAITSTAAHTLIVTGRWFDANQTVTSPSVVTDTVPNTWQVSTAQAANPPSEFLAGNIGAFVAWVLAASAVTSVSVTIPATGTVFNEFTVSEWTGIGSETAGGIQADGSGAVDPFTATLTVPGSGLMVAASDQVAAPGAGPPGTTVLTAASGSPYFAYQLTSGATTFTWGTATSFTTAAAAFAPPVTVPVLYSMRSFP
jgi:hypothetical protein